MAGNIYNIINAAHYPEVAVFIFTRSVSRKVKSFVLAPVLLFEALFIAIDCAGHRRPGIFNYQISSLSVRYGITFFVNNFGNNTRQRESAGTRLCRRRARNRGNHNRSGFCLPPGINDRAFFFADYFMIPHPRFGIYRFTDGPEQAEARQLVSEHPLLAPSHKRPYGCGSGVENVDPVFVDYAPEAVRFGIIRSAFIHNGSGAVCKRPVNNIGMSGDPSDIRSTPVNVLFLQVENNFSSEVGIYHIPGSGMKYSFGLAGGAACVENKQGMFGIELLGFVFIVYRLHQFVPPVVASGSHIGLHIGETFVYNNIRDSRAVLDRGINRGFKENHAAAPHRAVGRDYHFSFCIVNAVF